MKIIDLIAHSPSLLSGRYGSGSGRPGVIVSQTAYMHLPLRTAMDRPGLEPGSIFTIHSSAYEAAALTNCANDPFTVVTSSLCFINCRMSNPTHRLSV